MSKCFSTCSDSIPNVGHVKPLKIAVVVGVLYLFNSKLLSDITMMCLYQNSKEIKLNL